MPKQHCILTAIAAKPGMTPQMVEAVRNRPAPRSESPALYFLTEIGEVNTLTCLSFGAAQEANLAAIHAWAEMIGNADTGWLRHVTIRLALTESPVSVDTITALSGKAVLFQEYRGVPVTDMLGQVRLRVLDRPAGLIVLTPLSHSDQALRLAAESIRDGCDIVDSRLFTPLEIAA